MDSSKDESSHGECPQNQTRRPREPRRSLSESLAFGTSKFFSSIVAKKNGILSDLSVMIENTFAQNATNQCNGSESEGSATPPVTPQHVIPSGPPRSKMLPSTVASRDGQVIKRTASMPAYTRTRSKPELFTDKRLSNCKLRSPQKRTNSEERFAVNGMNISFDEPIYSRKVIDTSLPVTDILISDFMCREITGPRTRLPSDLAVSSSRSKFKTREITTGEHFLQSCNGGLSESKYIDNRYEKDKNYGSSRCLGGRSSSVPRDNAEYICKGLNGSINSEKQINIRNKETLKKLESKVDRAKQKTTPAEISKNPTIKDIPTCALSSISNKNEESSTVLNAPDFEKNSFSNFDQEPKQGRTEPPQANENYTKFPKIKQRSNTVDEILFDDYPKPEVDTVLSKGNNQSDLISFELEQKIQLELNSPTSSNKVTNQAAEGSRRGTAEGIELVGSAVVHRSTSACSDKSWSSTYSTDSHPDDVTIECMEFMKIFVEKIFHNSEEISQSEKAKFGQTCQEFPGRLWFSRYVSSQRVHNKRVTESVFFRLMQYFAVCLFECYDADDFTPAKTLMNMCFTFYYEVPTSDGQTEKNFLYMFIRDQPIWQSLRFWNAAYFDAVQCERSRKPMPTKLDGNDMVSADREFQENITFGQLGTFVCNMREFGLGKDLCFEFLRKQSTIANLKKEQFYLLKENIERVKDL